MAKKRKKSTKAPPKKKAPVRKSGTSSTSRTSRKALSNEEIETRLTSVDGWFFDRDDGRLIRDFAFRDFKGSLEFINKIAEVAEEMDHHPEIYNVYNQVSLALMTHSVDGVSEADFDLATRINKLG